MAVPFIVGGNLDEAVKTISDIRNMSLENIVQGHGDIILRGEMKMRARPIWLICAAFKNCQGSRPAKRSSAVPADAGYRVQREKQGKPERSGGRTSPE
jgi:hypothetical protein